MCPSYDTKLMHYPPIFVDESSKHVSDIKGLSDRMSCPCYWPVIELTFCVVSLVWTWSMKKLCRWSRVLCSYRRRQILNKQNNRSNLPSTNRLSARSLYSFGLKLLFLKLRSKVPHVWKETLLQEQRKGRGGDAESTLNWVQQNII